MWREFNSRAAQQSFLIRSLGGTLVVASPSPYLAGEPPQLRWIGYQVDSRDPAMRAGEPDDSHGNAAGRDDHASPSVDNRRLREAGKGGSSRENPLSHRLGSVHRLARARAATARVDAEHDVGVEHRHETFEVSLA